MDANDRRLGMGRGISRRDFLNGAGALLTGVAGATGIAAGAGSLVLGCADPRGFGAIDSEQRNALYPPALTGMRGSHGGSYDVAHDLALRGRRDWGRIDVADPSTYDLVVVGGGLSGLSAAYLQFRRDPASRILILDNHDDFGGHARRNEFRVGDRTLIGYGGSQTFESPQFYSDVTKELLADVGVDLMRLGAGYDQGFFKRHGLGGGVFFDRASYGTDRLVRCELVDFSGYLPLDPTRLSPEQAVAQMPISLPARMEMQRLLEIQENLIVDVPAERQEAYLSSISYRYFLERYLGVTEPEVFTLLQGVSTDAGFSIDSTPAADLILYTGLPGIGATAISRAGFEEDPYIAHFPDGNASLARLLVRAMIPRVAAGSTMEDIVAARFDYSRLDEMSSRVRIRLGSTVVRVEHQGSPDSADRVEVRYVHGGRAQSILARACVLAGYNAMVPYLCPELPEPQREALSLAVKMPILYSNVLLRNWHAWRNLGIGVVSAPGSYHANAMLDFPVSLGGYAFSESPDEPIIVHMERFARYTARDSTPRDQFRAERTRMLSTSFTEIEREIRTQLTGTLASDGFDPERDIEAITVNRWAHGYAYSPNPLFDDVSGATQPPHVIGRARFGRIAIANSDAGGRATVDTAIDQAHRAIEELASV